MKLEGNITGKYSKNYYLNIEDSKEIDFSNYCFIFSAQNSAYPGMFKEYMENSFFKKYFNIVDEFALKLGLKEPSLYIKNFDLIKDDKNIFIIKNLALFAVEVSLFHYLFTEKKVIPKILTGHSFGEYATLVCSGIIDFEFMVEFIYTRDLLCFELKSFGNLIAVNSSVKGINSLDKSDFEISNINGLNQIIIGVESLNLENVKKKLENAKLKFTVLDNVLFPYHSSYLNNVKIKLDNFLSNRDLDFSKPRIEIYSSVYNCFINSKNFDSNLIKKILINQIVENVDFVNQIENIFESKAKTFVELGPKLIFSNLTRKILKDKDFKILTIDKDFNNKSDLDKNEINSKFSSSKFLKVVQNVVAKVTGYEIESISIEDKFEDDLGIDSIKKADIVFTVLDDVEKEDENLNLSEINTILDLVEYLEIGPSNKIKYFDENSFKKIIGKNFSNFKEVWVEEKLNTIYYNNNDKNKNISRDVIMKISDLSKKNLNFNFLSKFENSQINNLIIESDLDLGINSFNKFISSDLIQIFNNLKLLFEEISELNNLNIILISFGNIKISDSFISFFKSIKHEKITIYPKMIYFKDYDKFEDKCLSIIYNEINEPFANEVKYFKNKRYIVGTEEFKLNDINYKLNKNSVIVVFGGAKGITYEGIKEISTKFKSNIYILGSSDYDLIKDNIIELKKINPNIYYNSVDCTNKKDLNRVLDKVLLNHKKIDLIINGVGLNYNKLFSNKSQEDILRELNVKLKPVLNSILLAKEYNVGKVINYSSIVARYSSHGQSIYSFSNKLINYLSKIYSLKYNIPILSICWPAWDNVGMTANRGVYQKLKEKKAVFIDKETANNFLIENICKNNSQSIIYLFDKGKDKKDLLGKNDNFQFINFNKFYNLIGMPQIQKENISFKKIINVNGSDKYLKEHILGKSIYFPASFSIGMFLCSNFLFNKNTFHLKSFKVLKPLIIKNKKEISIELKEKNLFFVSNNNVYFESEMSNQPNLNFKKVFSEKLNYEIKRKNLLKTDNLFIGDNLSKIDKFYLDIKENNVGILKSSRLNENILGTFFDKIILLIENVFHTLGSSKWISLPHSFDEFFYDSKVDFGDELIIFSKNKVIKENFVSADMYVTNKEGEVILFIKKLVKKKFGDEFDFPIKKIKL